VSVIAPAYNEEDNIPPLCKKIKTAMRGLDYEVIFVDDGSTDDTYKNLLKIKDTRFKVIHLKKHKGKDFAVYKGINESKGGIIATIDSDLQDDPNDLPMMIEELGNKYDCICGWRYQRKDTAVKRVSSKIANIIYRMLFSVSLHDNNCPLKIFKRECITKVKYFKNFHRFISVMIHLQGFKIKEHKVRNYPRIHGVSKYGLERFVINIKTILAIKFRYRELLK
jgi:glycosyltransferase involved in cell wall biosynthesis